MTFRDRMVGRTRCYLYRMVKRRFVRYRVDRPLMAVLTRDNNQMRMMRGRYRVLSEGGLDAILADQLLPGEVVSLELSPQLKVHAAVRKRRSFHYGFEFIQVEDAARTATV